MVTVQGPTFWADRALSRVDQSEHMMGTDMERAKVIAMQALVYATLATSSVEVQVCD